MTPPLEHMVGPKYQAEIHQQVLGTPVVPPTGLFKKLFFYSRRYGFVSTLARFVGRKFPGLWRHLGAASTRGYLRRWLAHPGRHTLNLGGGGNCMVECLTVDIDPRADAYVDLTRPLPFPDRSLDAIFCEEVLEHVDEAAGKRLLGECARILRDGGVLRLTTPDLSYFARGALESPHNTAGINAIFYDHCHKHLYTPESLARVCQETGFTVLRRSSYRDRESKLGWLDSHADRFGHAPEESQYLEVIRPA